MLLSTSQNPEILCPPVNPLVLLPHTSSPTVKFSATALTQHVLYASPVLQLQISLLFATPGTNHLWWTPQRNKSCVGDRHREKLLGSTCRSNTSGGVKERGSSFRRERCICCKMQSHWLRTHLQEREELGERLIQPITSQYPGLIDFLKEQGFKCTWS